MNNITPYCQDAPCDYQLSIGSMGDTHLISKLNIVGRHIAYQAQ